MTVIIRGGKILGDITYELARLEQLTLDIDRLAGGTFPDPDVIAAAPLLDRWASSIRPAQCLVGECRDHPRLNGPLIVTTDLWIMAPDLAGAARWAATTAWASPGLGRRSCDD